jgi:nicotinamide mononucleotide transporter
MNLYIEFLAAILTLGCVILLMLKNVWGWPVAIIAAALYMYTFYKVDLLAQTTLQFVFIIQSFYGWYNWGKDKNSKLKIRPITPKELKLGLLFVPLFSVIFVLIVNPKDSIIGGIDAFITGLALLANFLLTKKVIQSWYLWALVDLLSVCLFLAHELYWSVLLYAILMFIAGNTYKIWVKEYSNEKTI